MRILIAIKETITTISFIRIMSAYILKEMINGNKISDHDHAMTPVSFNMTNITVKVSAIPMIITSVFAIKLNAHLH